MAPDAAQSQVPLGIVDLMRTTRPDEEPAAIWDHWYWCRRHEAAEHVSQSPRPVEDCLPDCKMPGEHVHRECIRIGPFMSEREADRLGGPLERFTGEDRRLGMEVEQ